MSLNVIRESKHLCPTPQSQVSPARLTANCATYKSRNWLCQTALWSSRPRLWGQFCSLLVITKHGLSSFSFRTLLCHKQGQSAGTVWQDRGQALSGVFLSVWLSGKMLTASDGKISREEQPFIFVSTLNHSNRQMSRRARQRLKKVGK